MELKDIIKSRREVLGLTLQDIADYVGVSKPTIQRYESGEIINLKQGIIYKLSQILKISPAKLMGWENPDEAVSSIIEERLKETGMSLEEVASKSRVPLYWLQNIDTFIPGEMDDAKESREIGWNEEIGWYKSYERITRVAKVLGLPGSTLRAALARQEIPSYDGPVSTPEEDFFDKIDEQKSTEIELKLTKNEKNLISNYNKLNDIGQHEAIKRVEELTYIDKYKKEIPDYIQPVAAHLDGELTDEIKDFIDKF